LCFRKKSHCAVRRVYQKGRQDTCVAAGRLSHAPNSQASVLNQLEVQVQLIHLSTHTFIFHLKLTGKTTQMVFHQNH
jgi:hypothetical protein